MKKGLVLLGCLCLWFGIYAQEAPKVAFNAGLDVNSRYVWRGLLFSDAPNVQPYMSLTWKGLTAMAWGSYATSNNYAEVDLFLSYNTGAFTFNLGDFYNEDERNMATNDFTEWNDSLTNHLVEASVVYTVPSEAFPLSLTFSTLLYGADKNQEGNQNYSSYLEAAYPLKVDRYDMSFFCGATLSKGYYAQGAGFVNVGVNSSYLLKLSESFSVPLNLKLVTNPKNKDLFFVAGVSF